MSHQNKPHIIYIITKLELGGAQKVCLSLFEGLKNSSVSSSLISSTSGILVSRVQEQSCVYLLNSLEREISLVYLFKELKAFIELTKLLKKLKKEHPTIIVHTHSTKAGLLGRWAALCAGITTRVHTVHGYAFHPHQNKLAWSLIYLLELITSFITTHFICVSSHDIQTGRRLFPRFAKKHTLIRAAVEPLYFTQGSHTPAFPLSTENFIFGTIACFKPQKNLIDLLKAFSLVHQHNPRTQLEIIGDGDERALLEQWIRENNLTHAIILHGWQQHLIPIMQRWHAFMLSSLWEGLPCAIIEARLLKLPVLSYNTGGIADVIIHGSNGFLYNPKDWESLSAGMLTISTQQHIFNRLRSYQDDLRSFSTQVMLNQHVELYTKLIQKT